MIGLAGAALLAYATMQVVDIGACEGDCPGPSATASWLMALGGVVWLGGLLASRAGLVEPGGGQVVWTIGFLVLGALLLAEVLGAEGANGSAQVGVFTVGVLFLAMAAAVGGAGVVQFRRAAAGVRPRSAAREYADERARIRLLDDLRSSGALTRPEFDALRQRIAKRSTEDKLTRIQELAAERGANRLSDEQFAAAKRDVLS